MTQAELYTALSTLGIPVAYGQFISTPENPAPAPPFIVYGYSYSADVMADNQNYAEISNLQIELYSKTKDPANERKTEDLLKSLRLPYRKFETFIESERLRQVIYEVQLLEG